MTCRKAAMLVSFCALALGLLAASPQQPVARARFALGGNAAQVPAEFIGNLVFLPVRVNQTQPSLFELDSSAALSSIDPGRASELGITPAQPTALDFAGVDVSLAAPPATAKSGFGAQVGRDYEGTLGADFFNAVVVKVDYARQTVQLYDPASYQYSGPGKSFPLTFAGAEPVIQAKFSMLGGKHVEGEFAVNTALDASIVFSERYAQSHDLFSASLKTIPAADPLSDEGKDAALGRLKSFEIGPYVADSPLAAFSQGTLPAAGSRIAGEIGGGMLRRFTVIFDYPRQRIILEPNIHIQEEDEEDKSGLTIVAKGPGLKTFVVTEVAPATPAADVGIQKGDVIAGIDNEAAADLTLWDVRNLFRQIGHKYTLLLERNGQTLTVTFQMRRLL
ncbi:MAG: PDZ domain-containing protein [Candidatus Acidiferrales bacterium]